MTREQDILRGLVIYGVALPLAIVLGYLLAHPLNLTTLAAIGTVLMVLSLPLVLRWHHPLLFFWWNSTAVIPLLPGRPQIWLVMAFLSLGIFLIQYALVRNVRFVQTRSVLVPLLFIGAVALVTAQLTGGIGLGVLGDKNIGGKRYIYMFAGIAGYIAMTAQAIPSSKARLFVGLFLLGAMTNAIGNLLPYVPKALYPLFLMFPVEQQGIAAVVSQNTVTASESFVFRVNGFTGAMLALAFFLVARSGLGPLLSPRKPAFWALAVAFVLSTIGGFRSSLFYAGCVFGLIFFLEGLHRSMKMPAVVFCLLMVAIGLVAFSTHLPISMQRSLSFLPLRLDPVAVRDAHESTEWRLQMWRELLPEVPRYLLLGKGLSISATEMDSVTTLTHQGRENTAEVAMLAGDYHSGPLSVIIPFGVWGAVGWLWFLGAASRALYLNYRNSPIELKTINTFLFADFVVKTTMFFFIFGNFYRDVAWFAGLVGLSLTVNHGIRKVSPYAEAAPPEPAALLRPRLIPSFSRHLRR